MTNYEIRVTQTCRDYYRLEANSPEEAENCFGQHLALVSWVTLSAMTPLTAHPRSTTLYNYHPKENQSYDSYRFN